MRKSALSAVLCGLVTLCCTACASSSEKARATSTEAARAAAQNALQQLRGADKDRSSLEAAIEGIRTAQPGSNLVLRKTAADRGRFGVDFAFLTSTEAGGGGDYTKVAVRLCVSYSGDVGVPGSVVVVDLACPPGLPDKVGSVPISGDVRLSG
ncbi:hypothetical protein AB0F15_40805 [Amycolatopsis sp. NPDC026612]|uniref:hypothetical protein n=1 Tax=Amycolatopsis sp. NPDC026612 TaxID=3155466 RepID=UPI0033EF93A1